ncbi:hypothetical protein MRX96_009479 [Rhipicephalus microplus]
MPRSAQKTRTFRVFQPTPKEKRCSLQFQTWCWSTPPSSSSQPHHPVQLVHDVVTPLLPFGYVVGTSLVSPSRLHRQHSVGCFVFTEYCEVAWKPEIGGRKQVETVFTSPPDNVGLPSPKTNVPFELPPLGTDGGLNVCRGGVVIVRWCA